MGTLEVTEYINSESVIVNRIECDGIDAALAFMADRFSDLTPEPYHAELYRLGGLWNARCTTSSNPFAGTYRSYFTDHYFELRRLPLY